MQNLSIGRSSAVVAVFSSIVACGGGTGSNSLPGAVSLGATAASTTRPAFVVHLTARHTVVVVNAMSVAAAGNNVTIRYDSGATSTLLGEAPNVERTELAYQATPGAGSHPDLTPSCSPPWYYHHYDQAYNFAEINNGAGADYYYDLYWSAPAYDNFVAGTQTFTWSGFYAAGGTFSYTYGPTAFGVGYSSGIPSGQIDFDGGATHDYITGTTVRIDYTDTGGNTWDGYGTKSAARCTT